MGHTAPAWAPEPYLLRVPGAEERMVAEMRRLGHLVHILATSTHPIAARSQSQTNEAQRQLSALTQLGLRHSLPLGSA